MDGGVWLATVHGVTKESDVTERLMTLRPLGSDMSALLSSPPTANMTGGLSAPGLGPCPGPCR